MKTVKAIAILTIGDCQAYFLTSEPRLVHEGRAIEAMATPMDVNDEGVYPPTAKLITTIYTIQYQPDDKFIEVQSYENEIRSEVYDSEIAMDDVQDRPASVQTERAGVSTAESVCGCQRTYKVCC